MTLECHHQKFREFTKHELAEKVGEIIECDVCGKQYRVEHDPFEDKFLLVNPELRDVCWSPASTATRLSTWKKS